MQTDMATEQEYRERAKACIELAVTARTREQSVMLEHIANTWLRLADEVRMPEPTQCFQRAHTPSHNAIVRYWRDVLEVERLSPPRRQCGFGI